jgi:hypothetical protein
MKQMPARDKITLVLLVLMSVFLFADQRIMSAILPEISAEYGLDARMLGFIGSAFMGMVWAIGMIGGPAIGGLMMAASSMLFTLNFATLWWIPVV